MAAVNVTLVSTVEAIPVSELTVIIPPAGFTVWTTELLLPVKFGSLP
jgi:hypothetical protein